MTMQLDQRAREMGYSPQYFAAMDECERLQAENARLREIVSQIARPWERVMTGPISQDGPDLVCGECLQGLTEDRDEEHKIYCLVRRARSALREFARDEPAVRRIAGADGLPDD